MTDKNCVSCNGSGYYISADLGARNTRKLSYQCRYAKKVDVDNAWIVRECQQTTENEKRLEAFRAKWNLIN